MPRLSYQEQLIQEELETHIADMIDDLVAHGMDTQEAEHQARKEFGDIEEMQQQTLAQHPQGVFQRIHPVVFFSVAYSLLSVFLFLFWFIAGSSLSALRLEPILLWWVFGGITAFVLLLVRWIMEYMGMAGIAVARMSMVFTLLAALSLTGILDIDNFEGIIHALVFSVIVYSTLYVSWSRISVRIKQFTLYGFSLIVVWSTLIEQPVFSFIGTARCLFITPDATPLTGKLAQCHQVPFMSITFIPIYLLVLIGIPYILYFMIRYCRNTSTMFHRKLVLSAALIVMPILPNVVPDINNYGALDVIPWKAEIYSSYQEILGRDPQQKDIDFYATSRSYQYMDRVREALYTSEERKIKIDLIFQEVQKRNATPEEIQFFVDGRQSIPTIYEQVQKIPLSQPTQ